MSFKTPKEVYDAIEATGVKKANFSWSYILVQGFMAGCYIAFGGALALVVGRGGSSANFPYNSPGVWKFMFGAVFPIGLMGVIFTGAELFTGNTMFLIPPLLSGKIKITGLLHNWFWSYVGNFIGSFVFAGAIWCTQILKNDPFQGNTIAIAEGKCGTKSDIWKPDYNLAVLIIRAIACNWLVNLAVWLAISAHEAAGKILCIWWPIMTFVACGYEHSVANMFFIPMGIFLGAGPNLWYKFWGNLFFVTIGNIIGGSFFMGTIYWFCYGPSKAAALAPAAASPVAPAPAANTTAIEMAPK